MGSGCSSGQRVGLYDPPVYPTDFGGLEAKHSPPRPQSPGTSYTSTVKVLKVLVDDDLDEEQPPSPSPSQQSLHTTTGAIGPNGQGLVVDHLISRAHLLASNLIARRVFVDFFFTGKWIESLFSRKQEHFINFSNKNTKTKSFFREISHVKLLQYIVPSPKSGTRRTQSEEEEIASSMMTLIKRLKVKDTLDSEQYELHTLLGEDGLRGVILASALAVFLRSPEYRSGQATNWPDTSTGTTGTGSGTGSGKGLKGVGSFYHKSTKGKKEDPFQHIKHLFQAELVKLSGTLIEDVLSTETWVLCIQQALDKLPYAVSIAEQHGSIGYVNSAFTALSGYTSEEVLGKDLKLLQCDATEARQLEIITEALRRCEACKIGITNAKRNGDRFVNFLSLRPVLDRNRGTCTFVIGMQYDIDSEDSKVQDLGAIDNILLVYSQVLC